MLRYIYTCLFMIPSLAFSQEPILFPRTPDISPDNKTVVFSYLGDIWAVDATGGNDETIITTMPVGTECNKFPIGAECWLEIMCGMNGKWPSITTRGVNGPNIA